MKEWKRNDRDVCFMRVCHIRKPIKRLKLPPYKEDLQDGIDSVQQNLNNLRNMKRHFNKVGGSAQKRKMINASIKQLQQS